MAITEDILVRLRVAGQGQFASAMGGAATQTGKLSGAAQTAGKNVDETGKKAKAAGGKMSTFAGSVGKFAGATAALAGAQKVVKDAVGNAVDLGEQVNKSAVVFRGPAAKSVEAWSKTTSTALGISQRQALESAGVFGNMLVPMGLGRQKAAGLSKSLVTMAADMASFNNASPEETLDALRSGLSGETEPLRKFGVFLSEAGVKSQAMSMGLVKASKDTGKIKAAQLTAEVAQSKYNAAVKEHGKNSDEAKSALAGQVRAEGALKKAMAGKVPDLNAAQKAQATYALITKQSKDAQGDFGRTSDSLANKQRVLKAQYENATAALGQKLLPVLTLLANNLGTVAVVVGAIALAWGAWALGAAIAATATGTLAGGVSALGVAILANPVGLIAVALIAVVAAIVIAYKKVGWFRAGIQALWGAIKAGFGWLKSNWPLVLAILTGPFGLAVRYIIRHWNEILGFLKALPGRISSAASGMWDGIKHGFRSVINAIIGWWNGLEFKVPGIDKGPIHIGGFTLGVPDLPMLAGGGTIASGGAAIVGEQGPEIFVPGTAGTVLPNGGAIHTHVYLNGREIATAVGNAAADRRARR